MAVVAVTPRGDADGEPAVGTHADPHGPYHARPGYLETLEGLGSWLCSETSDQREHVLAMTALAVASSAAASATV